jgi:crotonobetainyl-CoA:carnitine CoA-transferase CaiB-like acyl-CoA transferase
VAILACLHARQSSGHGYTIDLSLLDCAIASQVNLAQAYLSSGDVPPRVGNAHFQIVPYQLFATADGWLVLNVGNDSQWQHFCEAAQASDLAGDQRFLSNQLRVENRTELIPRVETLMRQFTTSEWQSRLQSKNIPHSIVMNYEQLFQQEQIAARNMKVTVRDPRGEVIDLIGSPFHMHGTTLPEAQAPPRLGDHTDEVLRQVLGLEAKRIAELRKSGVV